MYSCMGHSLTHLQIWDKILQECTLLWNLPVTDENKIILSTYYADELYLYTKQNFTSVYGIEILKNFCMLGKLHPKTSDSPISRLMKRIKFYFLSLLLEITCIGRTPLKIQHLSCDVLKKNNLLPLNSEPSNHVHATVKLSSPSCKCAKLISQIESGS